MKALPPAIRNVGYNLAGLVLPTAIALVALPLLSHRAGTERLGFLGLAWSLIGYFALLDLGLSRIVTRRVALAELQGRMRDETRVVRRLCVRLFAGVLVVSALLAACVKARWIVGASASPALLDEAERALPVLLLTIPVTVVTGLLRGALEGLQRFARVNLLRSVFGGLSFAAPLMVLPFRHDLLALTASIALVRVLSLAAHGWWALQALDRSAGSSRRPDEARDTRIGEPTFGAMIREGGWLTVSNVVGPMMVTFDRFVIAAIVSLTATSYYFVPQEMALRLLVVPAAVASTIFPMMARLHDDHVDRHRISRNALLAMAAASLPACAVLAGLAGPLLALWMGPSFAVGAAPLAAIIAVGLFANCCAQAPFAWIQAAGRADVTGKLHLLQLPIYAVLLVALTWQLGVVGTAIAWSLRALTDWALLFIASSRLFPAVVLGGELERVGAGLVGLALLAAHTALPAGAWRDAWIAIGLTVCLALSAVMGLRLRRPAP